MIEQLFPGGGGGGSDELAKVSSNDTTAGYLNGKLVAGTGIGFTENSDGGNETLGIAIGNHDASLITTGTVATARLGTGTANSSTYLAGDQTYKAAVTSVNGSTGAVTVGAGDTTYALTLIDAENTSADTSIITFTVPANTWANNEFVWIEALVHINNGTGSTANLTTSIYTSGTQRSTYTAGQITGTSSHLLLRQYFYRDGSNIRTALANEARSYGAVAGTNWSNSAYWNLSTMGTYAATFTSDIALQFRAQWNVTSPIVYVRVLNARAYKQTGQQT